MSGLTTNCLTIWFAAAWTDIVRRRGSWKRTYCWRPQICSIREICGKTRFEFSSMSFRGEYQGMNTQFQFQAAFCRLWRNHHRLCQTIKSHGTTSYPQRPEKVLSISGKNLFLVQKDRQRRACPLLLLFRCVLWQRVPFVSGRAQICVQKQPTRKTCRFRAENWRGWIFPEIYRSIEPISFWLNFFKEKRNKLSNMMLFLRFLQLLTWIFSFFLV